MIKCGGVLQGTNHFEYFRNLLCTLKYFVLPICFIVLKWSLGIVRKSHKVTAFNFDPKGVKMGAPRNPGPEDPPAPNRVKYAIFKEICKDLTNM